MAETPSERRFTRRVPAARCASCNSPNRTHERHRGAVCADCGAAWPTYQVGP